MFLMLIFMFLRNSVSYWQWQQCGVTACCPQDRNTVIVTGGILAWSWRFKAAHSTVTVFLTHHGSMVSASCPQSGTLSSFSALTLVVGWQEGRPPVRNTVTTVHRSLLSGIDVTWRKIVVTCKIKHLQKCFRGGYM